MTYTRFYGVERPYPQGTLVAVVSSVDHSKVRRIARVLEDRDHEILVRTDDELENDVCIEHDLPAVEQIELTVPPEQVRPIIGEEKPH